MTIRDPAEASLDHAPIDQPCLDERGHEGAVLLPKRAELRDAQALLVEAPAREDRLPTRSRRVGPLNLDQSLAPPLRYGRRLQVDAVDTEAVELLERRELACDTFDDVGEAGRLVVLVSDGRTSTSSDIVASAGS
ncbi:MAG: hypothetical protein ABIR39_15745 [Nocardioides sp.]|uniref:hypothetical protein n=1 Tax=Nocardioides sp. TaxID=35761 RepID=UPI003266DDDF